MVALEALAGVCSSSLAHIRAKNVTEEGLAGLDGPGVLRSGNDGVDEGEWVT